MARRLGPHSVRHGRPTPSWLGQLPYAVTLLGVGAGLFWVWHHHFRRGSYLIAGAVLLAALLRLVLPEQRAGLLAVRHRAVDVLVLGTLGVGLGLIAFVVPPPS